MNRILSFLLISVGAVFSYGFTNVNNQKITFRTSELSAISRREAITSLTSAIGATAAVLNNPDVSLAADKDQPIYWKSGKAPIVPGQKPKDSNDVRGTRKDPDFLRSIATCKNQCENTLGSDGYAKSKEECLSDCQVSIICTIFK